jgi:predicted XRE-type DNA-binding protein
MKKRLKPDRISATPPPGWPSEKTFKEIEKKTKGTLATKLLGPDASPVEKVKQELCAQFIIFRQAEDITQRELARRLDITESRMSEILHYHHKQFTIDRLLGLLTKIRSNVTLKVA